VSTLKQYLPETDGKWAVLFKITDWELYKCIYKDRKFDTRKISDTCYQFRFYVDCSCYGMPANDYKLIATCETLCDTVYIYFEENIGVFTGENEFEYIGTKKQELIEPIFHVAVEHYKHLKTDEAIPKAALKNLD
jgi:hypothetical protein